MWNIIYYNFPSLNENTCTFVKPSVFMAQSMWLNISLFSWQVHWPISHPNSEHMFKCLPRIAQ